MGKRTGEDSGDTSQVPVKCLALTHSQGVLHPGRRMGSHTWETPLTVVIQHSTNIYQMPIMWQALRQEPHRKHLLKLQSRKNVSFSWCTDLLPLIHREQENSLHFLFFFSVLCEYQGYVCVWVKILIESSSSTSVLFYLDFYCNNPFKFFLEIGKPVSRWNWGLGNQNSNLEVLFPVHVVSLSWGKRGK